MCDDSDEKEVNGMKHQTRRVSPCGSTALVGYQIIYAQCVPWIFLMQFTVLNAYIPITGLVIPWR